MKPSYNYNNGQVLVFNANCLDYLKTVPDNTISSIVSDPPYGLSNFSPKDVNDALTAWLKGEPYTTNKRGFCDNTWDAFIPGPEIWKEVYRILKPGGHALIFSSTRTLDLMSMSLRLSGFEIRDTLFWNYFSGMPKSTSIGKLIDKHLGLERSEVIGVKPGHEEFANRTTTGHIDFKGATDAFDRPWMHDDTARANYHNVMAPVSEEAKLWEGFGYQLKPSCEPITMARKPLDGTIAENVLKWGVGGINIDACRIPTSESLNGGAYSKNGGRNHLPGDQRNDLATGMFAAGKTVGTDFVQPVGRYPSNFLIDDSEEIKNMFPISSTTGNRKNKKRVQQEAVNTPFTRGKNAPEYTDSGSASRFFFSAKASKHDRQNSSHSTVKPTTLMQYLVRLVTPPNGLILDPFAGTGSTGVAACLEGFNAVLVELSPEYVQDIQRKLENIVGMQDEIKNDEIEIVQEILPSNDGDDDFFTFGDKE